MRKYEYYDPFTANTDEYAEFLRQVEASKATEHN
jgi:hypothetical protein